MRGSRGARRWQRTAASTSEAGAGVSAQGARNGAASEGRAEGSVPEVSTVDLSVKSREKQRQLGKFWKIRSRQKRRQVQHDGLQTRGPCSAREADGLWWTRRCQWQRGQQRHRESPHQVVADPGKQCRSGCAGAWSAVHFRNLPGWQCLEHEGWLRRTACRWVTALCVRGGTRSPWRLQ